MGITSVSASTLPSELWIQIFSYLAVPSLITVSGVSKEFNTFFEDHDNANAIWRNACLLHGLVAPSTIVSDGEGHSMAVTEPPKREWGRWTEWKSATTPNAHHGEVRWSDVVNLYSNQSFTGEHAILTGNVDWKAFLKRRLEIHRSWSGQLPSDIVNYPSSNVRFAPCASKSHLAILHRAMTLVHSIEKADLGSLPEEELSSPSGHIKRRLEVIKTLLGQPVDEDFPAQTNRGFLDVEAEWMQLMTVDFPQKAARVIPSMQQVHRIKVDEKNGFVLTTHTDGGLVVTDIQTKEILWCLPKCHVLEAAHLEYEQGYFVFDREDGSKEVWRSSSIPPTEISAPSKPPDKAQLAASALANGDNDDLLRTVVREAHPELSTPKHGILPLWSPPPGGDDSQRAMGLMETVLAANLTGNDERARGLGPAPFLWVNLADLQRVFKLEDDIPEVEATTSGTGVILDRLSPQFVPHMLIPPPIMPIYDEPDRTWASRLVYPFYLAASGTSAYVWDVRTGEQVQTIANIQEFAIPERYPGPAVAPPTSEDNRAGANGKEEAEAFNIMDVADEITTEVEREMDGSFPIFRPFKSGFLVENATYRGNLQLTSTTDSPSPGRHPLSDPLDVHTNPPAPIWTATYIELSERWIFICGEEGLRLFARTRDLFDNSDVLERVKRNLGHDLHTGDLALRIVADRIHYSRWHASLGMESFRGHWGSELVRQQVLWDEEVQSKTEEEANQVEVKPPHTASQGTQEKTTRRRLRLLEGTVAVHVSPDQKHFVALFHSSRLLFVPYFERIIAGEDTIWDSGIEIQLGPVSVASVYLSYGSGESGSGGSAGRISVVTEAGIFVVTPYFNKDVSSGRKVNITVHRLAPSFMEPKNLQSISCLQMSDTGLWVNWFVPEAHKPPSPPPPADSANRPRITRLRRSWLIENGFLTGDDVDEDGDEDEDVDSVEPDPGDETDDGDEWEDFDGDYSEVGDVEMDDEHSEDSNMDNENDRGDERAGFGEGPDAENHVGGSHNGSRTDLAEAGSSTSLQHDDLDLLWPDNNLHPLASMEESEDEVLGVEGPPPTSATTDDQPETAEGKQREAKWSTLHPSGLDRVWTNQYFPLESTPPSQCVVEGGKCKWNYHELQKVKQRLNGEERDAILYENAFQQGLGKQRLDRWGTPTPGAVYRPATGGDLRVETERVPRRRYNEADRYELHQIRFVPL
ncbi:hypothetical protein NMY22_g6722 [Coprinellus aureogranulatus]|nr:hypothetical protein NMY22_g6722 [Coprinellus aureogranulatus]